MPEKKESLKRKKSDKIFKIAIRESVHGKSRFVVDLNDIFTPQDLIPEKEIITNSYNRMSKWSEGEIFSNLSNARLDFLRAREFNSVSEKIIFENIALPKLPHVSPAKAASHTFVFWGNFKNHLPTAAKNLILFHALDALVFSAYLIFNASSRIFSYPFRAMKNLKKPMAIFFAPSKKSKLRKKKREEKKYFNEDKFNILPRNLSPLRSKLYSSLAICAVIIAISLPIKAFTFYEDLRGNLIGKGSEAAKNFTLAGKSLSRLDFNTADKNFSQAANDFKETKNTLDSVNSLIFTLASLAPDENIRAASQAKKIAAAGESASTLGQEVSNALNVLMDKESGKSFSEKLNLFGVGMQKASIIAQELSTELKDVDENKLPENIAPVIIELKNKSALLERSLGEASEFSFLLSKALGGDEDKRYLIVFQNNAEMRGSGGFVGSFALVDFKQGAIKNIEAPKGGSYDMEGGMTRSVASPDPLTLIKPRWYFWDANWWPDWPTSAEKLSWFYEKSGGPTVDGVIAITPTAVERFLEIVGPIKIDKYGEEFNKDNFWLKTQTLAEQKDTNQSKAVIGDLFSAMMEKLNTQVDGKNIFDIASAIVQNFEEKQILLYSYDPETENKFIGAGWGGEMKESPLDYLMVANTNIAGGKSDRKISQEISHKASVAADGSIDVELTIKRKHNGVRGEEFSGIRNVDWMRIYVPEGSQLISAEGFKKIDDIYFKTYPGALDMDPTLAAGEGAATVDETSGTKIYRELGKTVFANWSFVDPGEETEIKLTYRLPFALTEKQDKDFYEKAREKLGLKNTSLRSYVSLFQKQPGDMNTQISSELSFEDKNNSVIWQYPGDFSVSDAGWKVSRDFSSDFGLGALWDKSF